MEREIESCSTDTVAPSENRGVLEAKHEEEKGSGRRPSIYRYPRLVRNKLLGPAQDNDVEFTWVLENGDQRVVSMSVEVRRQLPLILRYEIRGADDKSEHREPVQLRVGMGFSPCHYGGRSRPWFLCPGEECSRRVATLYLEGRAFLCRRCASLTYPCRRLDRRDRALLQTRKLRTRLGGVHM